MELPVDIIRKIISYNNSKLSVMLNKTYKKMYKKTPTYNNINQKYFLCMFNYEPYPINKKNFYSCRFNWGISVNEKFKFHYHKITDKQRNKQNNKILNELKRYDIIRCIKNANKTNIYYIVYLGGDYFVNYKDIVNERCDFSSTFVVKSRSYVLKRSKSIVFVERVINRDLKEFFNHNDNKLYKNSIKNFDEYYKKNEFITCEEKRKEKEKEEKKIALQNQQIENEIKRKEYEIRAKKYDEEYEERQKQLKEDYDKRMIRADEFQKQTLLRIFGTDDKRNLYPKNPK